MMDLKSQIRGRVLIHVLMKSLTSLRIGGRADILAYPLDEDDLGELLAYAGEKNLPYYVVGRCTNLLVKDGGVRGLLIDLSEGFNRIDDSGPLEIVAEAGVPLRKVMDYCVNKDMAGLEFASGIPGTLGGAIAMNAGAYGSEMRDVVSKIEIMGEDGVVRKVEKESLNFTYRGSNLNDIGIVLRAYLRLCKGNKQEMRERIKAYSKKRVSTQTVSYPNAGSIFKNPPEIPAGRLIDELDLKGCQVGGAQISEVHGNYIVNVGKASSKDVLSLIALAQKKAMEERGISLELEIKIIGED
jgi:UDP-N-acetylmuramate dehydrogenase